MKFKKRFTLSFKLQTKTESILLKTYFAYIFPFSLNFFMVFLIVFKSSGKFLININLKSISINKKIIIKIVKVFITRNNIMRTKNTFLSNLFPGIKKKQSYDEHKMK